MADLSITLWSTELRILKRVIYKSKRQHRSALYFYRLQQLQRTLSKKEIDKEKAISLCRKAFFLFEKLIHQAFFMPLATVCIAMLSRISFLLQNGILETLASHAPAAAILNEETDPLNFFSSDFRPATEDGDEIDEIFSGLTK